MFGRRLAPIYTDPVEVLLDTVVRFVGAHSEQHARVRDHLRGHDVAVALQDFRGQRDYRILAGIDFRSFLVLAFSNNLDEVDDYGKDVLEMQSRMARGVVEEEVGKHIPSLIKRLEILERGANQSSDDAFWSTVETQVPGARAMNDADPLWHDFLNRADQFGMFYRDIGQNAIEIGNVTQLVNLF